MTTPTSAPSRQLSLFDSTNIIVGIIIGVGIYQMAPNIASGAGTMGHWIAPWFPFLSEEAVNRLAVLLFWVIGGLISLFGALGYAELGAAFPRAGGDYVYLSRAYGKWAGYLFGWVQLSIVKPGDIAVMAFAFATYAIRAGNPSAGDAQASETGKVLAAGAVLFFTAMNIVGVRQGKWTQNLLTVVKALGLLIIAIVAFTARESSAAPAPKEHFPLMTAMVFVLFTYGGWNEMAYVAAEVKDPRRNIARALVLGTLAVIVFYLLLNTAFLHVLGYNGVASSEAVATDVVAKVFPAYAGQAISLLICISALGVVNGLIFTGARISYALGQEHPTFRPLGLWNSKTGTPIWALLLQGTIAMAMILLTDYIGALIYVSVAVYLFYLATSAAVIVLRFREPQADRPYKVTGFPIPTLIFCVVCGYLIYSCIQYALWKFPNALLVMAGTFLFGVVLLIADVSICRVRQKLEETK
ncbi:MAG: amino acid permease [Phycisphaerae bacterium]|nr:amino acid permease [Phycisphaerae bacterium]